MQTTSLQDLCDLITTQVDPRDHGHGLYLGLEHVESGRFLHNGGGRASEVASSKFAFKRGDILYGKLRPYLDKAVLAEADGVCTTELLVLRPKTGMDTRFLVALLHSPGFIEYAMSGVTGVQHPRTSWHHISNFQIPAFDQPNQVLIADVVWATHDAISATGSVIAGAGILKRTAMRELFTHGLRGEARKETDIGAVPKSWRLATLGSIAKLERGRFMHRPRNEPRFYGGATPFVQTGDIVRSGGRLRDYTQTLNEDGVAISRVFPRSTILITIAANIGYVGILEFDAACPDSLIAITPIDNVTTEFLNYFLQTQQGEMDRLAPKGTQKNINIQFLNPWPVVVPSLDEQREIVAILDAIDRKIGLHKRKKAVLEELFRALLNKLMTGEIRVADVELSALHNGAARAEAAA